MLFENALIKCWGGNGGKLGQGDTQGRGNTVQTLGADIPFVNLGENVSLNFASEAAVVPTSQPGASPTSASAARLCFVELAVFVGTIVAVFVIDA